MLQRESSSNMRCYIVTSRHLRMCHNRVLPSKSLAQSKEMAEETENSTEIKSPCLKSQAQEKRSPTSIHHDYISFRGESHALYGYKTRDNDQHVPANLAESLSSPFPRLETRASSFVRKNEDEEKVETREVHTKISGEPRPSTVTCSRPDCMQLCS